MDISDLKPRLQEHENERDWLTCRHPGMGSSDAAGVLGWSAFDSPYSKWYEKSNPPDLDNSREPQLSSFSDLRVWGHLHEPTIADFFQQLIDGGLIPELAGCTVVDPGDYTLIWAPPPDDKCFCTVDRLILRGTEIVGPLECKCAFFSRVKEFDETLPMAYRCQASHQMLCLGPGVDRAYYACLLGGCDFRWYQERRNERFLSAMRKQYAAFWRRVETGAAPPPDAHEATRHAITRQYSDRSGDTVYLQAPADDVDVKLQAVKARIALDSKREKALSNRMRTLIGNAETGILPSGKSAWSWKPNKNGTLALKRINKWPPKKSKR